MKSLVKGMIFCAVLTDAKINILRNIRNFKSKEAIVSVSTSGHPDATGNELGWIKFEKGWGRRCGETRRCRGVCVTGTVRGLTDGLHGFHIHKQPRGKSSIQFLVNMFLTLYFVGFGIDLDTRGPSNCGETSSHYDPYDLDETSETPHALPSEPPNDFERHVGALGNIESLNGIGYYEPYCSESIELSGDYSIIGKGFTIHSGEDLGLAKTNSFGGAGSRVACGTIDELR